MRTLAMVLAGVVLALGIAAWLVLATFEAPPVDPAWAVEGADEVPDGAVSVRFTGTSTLVFSDGATTWLTDGWFTRYGALPL